MVYRYVNQEKRFGERIKFRINVRPEVSNYKLPAMTLQPLVENSIIHGLEPKRKGGTIVINGKIRERNLLIEVIDSGTEISEERRKEIFENDLKETGHVQITRIGLANVRKRLFHFFNNQVQMRVESEENYWTKISMILPYEKQDTE